MSIAKVIEISSSSKTSIEDAVRNGLKKVAETVQGTQGAWSNETKVEAGGEGNVVEWRVNLRVTFIVQ